VTTGYETLAPNDKLLDILASVDFDRDIRPHLKQYWGVLVWSGSFDRCNRSPITQTKCGLKVHVVQLLGLAYERALNTHPDPCVTLTSLLTQRGNLRKFGHAGPPAYPDDIDPRDRRFGVLGSRSGISLSMRKGVTSHRPLSTKNKKLVRRLSKAFKDINQWALYETLKRKERR